MALEDEQELLDRLRARDQAAWSGFVERHRRGVWSVAYRMTGNIADAEEAMQETFLAFSRSLPGFRGEARASTYLYRIAVHAGIRIRRDRPLAPRNLDPLPESAAPAGPPVEDPADRDALLAKVRDAVLTLPDQQRAVFILRHYEGKSVAEAAAILELAPGTVKAHLHQAVANLRDRLKHLAPRLEGGMP